MSTTYSPEVASGSTKDATLEKRAAKASAKAAQAPESEAGEADAAATLSDAAAPEKAAGRGKTSAPKASRTSRAGEEASKRGAPSLPAPEHAEADPDPVASPVSHQAGAAGRSPSESPRATPADATSAAPSSSEPTSERTPRQPGPPKVSGLTLELYQALSWLARLLHFRVQAQADGALDPSLGLTDLVDELADACGEGTPTLNAPPELPEEGWLPTLCRTFMLSPTDSLLIAAAVAPTVDGRFAMAFGRFSASPRPERPTTDLLARLLAFTLPERSRLAGMLRAGGPLERFGLLQLDYGDNALLPLNFQPLNVSDRMRWFLLEEARELPPTLQRLMSLHQPQQSLAQVPLDEKVKERLQPLVRSLAHARAENLAMPVIVLEGPWGAGQHEIAEALAHALQMTVLELNLSAWVVTQEPPQLTLWLRREALLQNSVLLLRAQSDEQGQEIMQQRIKQLLELELEGIQVPVVVSGNLATLAGLRDLNRPLYRFELRLPSRTVQRQALSIALTQEQLTTPEQALDALLNRYNLDLTSTRDVIRTAHALARSARTRADQRISQLEGSDLELAVEMILRRHLGELSQRLSARYNWEDLILSDEIVSQLKTLRHLIEHKHLVFDTWGLGRKSGGGQGIKALFSGPSGTGKTMSAEVIASDLRLPLYRVDLSAVVSKWVGETEKNLEKIFREAQGSQAILLFDEADALFGKRGNVENANDRHANLEVSFLLQRFEVHDGVVILTTNFPTVIDTAFARRMQFVIEYESPDENTRKKLWQKQLVPSLPQQPDIDINWLAQRFEISGANIRNVVMASAFLAAAENCAVGMRQIARGMQWEYQKLGRSVSSSDFGRFFR